MADLPAYTGPDHHCPKCAVAKVKTTWRRTNVTCPSDHPRGEHLDRKCTNCWYSWAEACASG